MTLPTHSDVYHGSGGPRLVHIFHDNLFNFQGQRLQDVFEGMPAPGSFVAQQAFFVFECAIELMMWTSRIGDVV